MKTKNLLLSVILFFCASASIAQPGFGVNGSTKYISGDVKFLKGQTSINLKFSYENLMVGNLSENEYITKKTQEQNRMKSGSGETWSKKWVDDRITRYEPEFLKWFISSIKKLSIVATSVSGEASTPYTLLIKTIIIEPGVYTGVSTFGHDVGQETFINIQADFVETTNSSNILASIAITKVVGSATSFANYDEGLRITNAYMNAGKNLGSFIVKNQSRPKR
jgi:hypothetical protein